MHKCLMIGEMGDGWVGRQAAEPGQAKRPEAPCLSWAFEVSSQPKEALF